MKELQIEKVAYQWENPHGIWVILREKGKQRRITMIVGQFEGQALLQGLTKTKLARPFTHDLLATTVETLGATVKQIVLTEFREENHTFYSSVVVELNGATHNLDARPSDALALAVRTQAPIFAEDSLWGDTMSKQPRAKPPVVSVPSLVSLWPVEKPKFQKKAVKSKKHPGYRR